MCEELTNRIKKLNDRMLTVLIQHRAKVKPTGELLQKSRELEEWLNDDYERLSN